jgi:hypothetical protein
MRQVIAWTLLVYRNSCCTDNNKKATGDAEVMVDVTDTVQ